MTPPRNDYSDLATLIQAAINPMVAKMQILENKVDNLNQDRVTRTDLEKLRGEIVGSFVDRASYEARHAAIIDRSAQLEMSIRELRKDVDQDLQKFHERLESGKLLIEDRFKEQQQAQLSGKDRSWIRWSQVVGYAGITVAVLDFLLQHIKFSF